MNSDHRGLAGVVRRHPLTVFFVWFFTVGQAFAFAPLVFDVSVAPQWFINGATVFGLFLPALVITRILDGQDGLREFVRRIAAVRAPLGLYAVGVIGLPLLVFVLGLVVLGAPDVPTSTVVSGLGSAFLVNAVVGFVLNNLWEEAAWMGFVQVRLQDRHGPLRAALIVAPLFALQHLALYISNGPVMAVVFFLGFTLVTIPFRAFVAWLYNRTGSLFLVGLVHAVGNATTVGAGFVPGYLRLLYPDDADVAGVLHPLAFALLGLVVIAATRGRLGLPQRRARTVQAEPGLAATPAR